MMKLSVVSAATLTLVLSGCAEEQRVDAQKAASRPAAAQTEARAAVEEVPSPAGKGAAEPYLSTSRNGVLLSWLEPVAGTDRFALRFSRYDGSAWSAPRTIIERNDLFVNWADFPSIVEDGKGALFAHWLQKSGAGTYSYDVQMAASTDGGSTWGKPFLLNRDGKQAEHGFASLVPLAEGGVAATWLDGRHMTSGGGHDGHESGGDMAIRYAKVDTNGKISEESELDKRTCECCTTGMTMTASGPVIVYRDRSPEEIRDISYVRRGANGWSEPRRVREDNWKIPGCPVNGPQIDAIGNHVATAWFTAANNQQRVFAAFSQDGGATFGQPVVIDDGKPIGRVDLVMLDENTALVSWLEGTATGGAEVRARRVSRGSKPGPAMKIAESGSARSSGFTRIARAGSDVWFAWTGQNGKDKQVHVGRVRL